jgi:hypothetical protein
MKVTCNDCCIQYLNSDSPVRKECDIKGSFTDFLPIVVAKGTTDTPPLETLSHFTLFENSKIPNRAGIFSVRELYNTGFKEILTRPILHNLEGPYQFKACFKFSSGSMKLKCRSIEFFSGGKLLSASITATRM